MRPSGGNAGRVSDGWAEPLCAIDAANVSLVDHRSALAGRLLSGGEVCLLSVDRLWPDQAAAVQSPLARGILTIVGAILINLNLWDALQAGEQATPL